jgi:hypothetical protein
VEDVTERRREWRLSLFRMDRSWSPSSESEGEDFCEEVEEEEQDISSYALRVRRMGPEGSSLVFEGLPLSETFLGRVSAQFSQGIARFLSASS